MTKIKELSDGVWAVYSWDRFRGRVTRGADGALVGDRSDIGPREIDAVERCLTLRPLWVAMRAAWQQTAPSVS